MRMGVLDLGLKKDRTTEGQIMHMLKLTGVFMAIFVAWLTVGHLKFVRSLVTLGEMGVEAVTTRLSFS